MDQITETSARRLTLDLDQINARALPERQRRQVAFERAFVYDESGDTPLGRLLAGDGHLRGGRQRPGRGGGVRLRLYLCITMLAVREPFDVGIRLSSPLQWAERVGLAGSTRTRVLNYNMKWLADKQYIKRERRTGAAPQISLLDIGGTGAVYRSPRLGGPWVNLPTELFANGWLVHLSPVALAVVMMLENQRAREKATPERGVNVPGYDRERYGLSENTWYHGAHELRDAGLVGIEREQMEEGDYLQKRIRNRYRLNLDGFKEKPD